MMKTYESLKEIEIDLKKIDLERQIALEELKLSKHDFEQHFKPFNILRSVLKFASKYGILILIKKIFK